MPKPLELDSVQFFVDKWNEVNDSVIFKISEDSAICPRYAYISKLPAAKLKLF